MSKPTKKASRNLNLSLAVGLVGSILSIVFALQNAEDTEIEFFIWDLQIPTALLIICSIAAGSLISILFGLPGWWRKRRTIKSLENEIQQLEQQILEKNKPTQQAGS